MKRTRKHKRPLHASCSRPASSSSGANDGGGRGRPGRAGWHSWVRRAKGASHGPLRGNARPAAPRCGWKRGWNRGWNRVESWVEPSILSTVQVMGSLACDEGEAATPAPGAAKRDPLEPSLRARFKDMQKIGDEIDNRVINLSDLKGMILGL